MAQTIRWKTMEYPSTYSNLIGFSMTPNDVSLIFGEVDSATPDEVLGTPRIKVILSPEQGSNLARFLTIALGKYVQENGPLRASAQNTNDEDIKQALEKNTVKALKG
jgi:hypothetical protein